MFSYDAKGNEFNPGSPASKTSSSASSSLNAAIQAKKEAEKARAAAEEAERQSKMAANKAVEEKTSGWWATVDTGLMNADTEEKKEAKQAFSAQFSLTGQAGIGSSLFNIQRGSLPQKEEPTPVSNTALPQDALASSAQDSGKISGDAALISAAIAAGSSKPLPVAGEVKPAGWGTQMEAGHLFENKETEDLDRKAKQGFTPQLVMGVGRSLFGEAPTSAVSNAPAPAAAPAAAVVAAIDSTAAAVDSWEPFKSVPPAVAPSSAAEPVAASSPKPTPPAGGEAKPAGWGTQMEAGHLFENKETEDLDRKAKQGFTPQLVMGVGSRMFPVTENK